MDAPFCIHPLLDCFNNPAENLGYQMHAIVLKKLFINQGFYNLFIAIGAIIGLNRLKKSLMAAYALLLLVSFASFGAGVVLAITSNAYFLDLLQAAPAAWAFIRIYPLYKISSTVQ